VSLELDHTYFVGRREFEAAEVYAVSAAGVERLERSLDWHGSPASKMELSDLVIRRVAARRPSRELRARFALYVLDRLPDGGFVLDSDDVRRWLRLGSDPDDFAADNYARRSWTGRLRTIFRGTATHKTHA
jgi:hypothetical protein